MYRIEWVIGSFVFFFIDNFFIFFNILIIRKFFVILFRFLDLYLKLIVDIYNLVVVEENFLRDKYVINCIMCFSDGGYIFWNLCFNLNFWNVVKFVL